MADVELNSIGNGDGTNYLVRDNTKIPLSGSNQISGSLIPSTDNAYNLGDSTHGFAKIFTTYMQGTQQKELSFFSSNNTYNPWNYGAGITLYANDYSGDSARIGTFVLRAQGSGDNHCNLIGTPSGTLTWGNKNVAMAEDVVPRSGGAVLNATLLGRVDTGNIIIICGGTDKMTGASIQLNGKDAEGNKGVMFLNGCDGTSRNTLAIKPDGTITANNGVVTKNIAMQEDVVPRSGGAVMTEGTLAKTTNGSGLQICGGTGWANGGSVGAYGKDKTGWAGAGGVYLHPSNGSIEKDMVLSSDGTWTWSGTACQITSDQRYKQQITEIDDKLLDAWEDVNLVQFKYNDAVDQKGKDKARLHTGYVVQQIDDACKKHNVDVSKYGLYCHEVYQEETREVEQADGTKKTEVVRPASEYYSLRYTEALIVECAYLRKKNKDLQEQLNALSERLEKLENR